MHRNRKHALKLTAIYLVFGLAWIGLSDWFVAALTDDPATLTSLQNIKGWLFVTVTAVLVWLLISHAQKRQERLSDRARESESRFRAVFENINDGLLIYDPDRDAIVGSNGKMQQLFGCNHNRIESLSIADLSAAGPEGNAARARKHLDKARAGEPSRFEWHVKKPGGTEFWADVSVKAATIRRKPRVLMVVREITEQKLARERLRMSAAVFENTRDGIAISDLQPRILAVNPAYCRISGYSADEVLGMDPTFLRAPDTPAEEVDAMWKSLANSDCWSGEIRIRSRDGSERDQLLTVTRISDDQDRPSHYVAVYTDISPLKQSRESLERLAYFHPLTDLPNRLSAQQLMERMIARAENAGTLFGLVFVDLDHFKNINDSFGHPLGDDLLLAVSRRLKDGLPETATLVHLGADEFALLLEDLPNARAAEILTRTLLSQLQEPFQVGQSSIVYLTASAGISLCPEHTDCPHELVQYAHAAMSLAKKQGRQGYQVFMPRLVHEASERLQLEARLRQGFDRGEFLLHYQPLVAGAEGTQVVGLEALARWNAGDGTLVMPDEFIAVAEDNGLIVPLGEWVLRESCRQGQAWVEAGNPDLVVAVNLSVRQFRRRDMAATVRDVLAETGFPAANLQLELTESVLLEQGESAIESLRDLKELGVILALDDFGTGYSCLSYLRRLPLDLLKIDRQFIGDMEESPAARELVAAIISMARCLNLEVVAEGVENIDQQRTLLAMGCRRFQGFLFGHPVDAESISARLSAGASMAE